MANIRVSPQKRSFVQRINAGKVLPIISQQLLADLILHGNDNLAESYADYISYPFPDKKKLLEMAHFKGIYDDLDDWELKTDFLMHTSEYLFRLAETGGVDEGILEEVAEKIASPDMIPVSELAGRLGYPRFDSVQEDPLLILADLPLPIYLTTSQYSFMEEALRTVGKHPETDFCRWHSGLDGIPSIFDGDYEPTDKRPLVYHLHGLDEYPDSLMLTEDDYLAFLVAISQPQNNTDPIPSRVRQAVTDSALVFLGFDLPGWDFRVLFWGLIKPASKINKGAFTLQLKPSDDERKYLQNYLRKEANLEIEWKDIFQYTHELKALMG